MLMACIKTGILTCAKIYGYKSNYRNPSNINNTVKWY
ncbi:hypothetical protein BGW94_0524 [Fibrobacter sp. NR9]|nr:hypothetical protein BGX14_2626 [Fibrobacter sp. UWS1]PBC72939.1 hypothetical protein BGW94_0524 [Fibrobacter sp. NR9]